jgi:hypothetical protein
VEAPATVKRTTVHVETGVSRLIGQKVWRLR